MRLMMNHCEGDVLGKNLGCLIGGVVSDALRYPVGLGKKFWDWQRRNPYFGKYFSVLGDSLSTLEGFNPEGYKLFYQGEVCERSGVFDMDDTWWGRENDFFGGKLLVNDSWSGSRVAQFPDSDSLFPAGCSDERTENLHRNSKFPDVILVHLGSNDFFNGVPVKLPV